MRGPRSSLPFVVAVGSPFQPPESPALETPPVDVVDDGTGWRLVFEIPGSSPDRMVLAVRGRSVLIRGERRPTEGERGRFLRVERATGLFERQVELPEEPDAEAATARYADGLLTVEIPRLRTAKGGSIPIHHGPAGKTGV